MAKDSVRDSADCDPNRAPPLSNVRMLDSVNGHLVVVLESHAFKETERLSREGSHSVSSNEAEHWQYTRKLRVVHDARDPEPGYSS